MFSFNMLIARIKKHWVISLGLALLVSFVIPMMIPLILALVAIYALRTYVYSSLPNPIRSGLQFMQSDTVNWFVSFILWIVAVSILSMLLHGLASSIIVDFIIKFLIYIAADFLVTVLLGLYTMFTEPKGPKGPGPKPPAPKKKKKKPNHLKVVK